MSGDKLPPGSLEDRIVELQARLSRAHRAAEILGDHVKELESALVAGNLCEAEVSLVSGSPADTEMRQAPAGFWPLSMALNGEERFFADSMSVLVHEANGMAVWRYYRKAGH